MNSTSLVQWAMDNQNMALVNVVQQAVGLLFSLLIFFKSYDFESCLKSVREQREAKKREKERQKLLKFQKMLELARSGELVNVANIVISENESSSEEKENVMKIAKKKKNVQLESAV